MTGPRGIRTNVAQFSLLVGINGLVGALVGQERTLVPLLAEEQFGVRAGLATTSFLVTFGLAKAPSNLAAGYLAERFGPKRVLVLGWLTGMPVPLILMWAPSWAWVIAANLFLGVNQGLTWSTTVLMKIQLAGDHQRGRAVGLNEFAGYSAMGISALFSGVLADRFGLQPEPFVLGAAIVLTGVLFSAFWVREARPPTPEGSRAQHSRLPRDRLLLTCARTGLVNNANDAFAWALLPLLLTQGDFATSEVATVVATYPIVWGILQPFTGALSDRLGRRAPIAAGMLLQALALAGFTLTRSVGPALSAAALLGAGTALAYPSLIAAVADLAPEHRRPSAIGFFRMCRDAGYVVGALAFGSIAGSWGLRGAAAAAALATALSGLDATLNLRPKLSSELLTRPTMSS